MKFKFDQIEIDLKIRKSPSTVKSYQAVTKTDMRMHKVNASVAR